MRKQIEVITHFDKTGKVTPYRIKYEDAEETAHVIHVDRVVKCVDSKQNGNPMRIYTCNISDNGRKRQIVTYYEIMSGRWCMD